MGAYLDISVMVLFREQCGHAAVGVRIHVVTVCPLYPLVVVLKFYCAKVVINTIIQYCRYQYRIMFLNL